MRTLNQVKDNNELFSNRILQWRDTGESKSLYVSQPNMVEFVCFNVTEDYKQAMLWEKIKFGSHFFSKSEKGLLLIQYYNANNIKYELVYSDNVEI